MSDPSRPLYARLLRLRHLRPSGLVCFLLFEGMIAVGVLLALAELVSWWAVPLLPAVVAGMVKLNDLVAGAPATGPAGAVPPAADPAGPGSPADRPGSPAGPGGVPPPRGARQVSRDLADALDPADSPRQRFRQSARRRYR